MKKCAQCNDFALYDDITGNCPICGATLVTYSRGGSMETSAINNVVHPNNTSCENDEEAAPVFENKQGFRYVYRGIITEVSSHSRFHNRLKKWINAIFRAEPYQFGNTSHETIFRLEEFTNGKVAGRKQNFVFYGDVEGRLIIGDDATVTAKRRGDRYIVTRLFLNETGQHVRPAFQIPSGLITVTFGFALVFLVALVTGVGGFIASGALYVVLEKLLSVAIVALLIYWIFKGIIKG